MQKAQQTDELKAKPTVIVVADVNKHQNATDMEQVSELCDRVTVHEIQKLCQKHSQGKAKA